MNLEYGDPNEVNSLRSCPPGLSGEFASPGALPSSRAGEGVARQVGICSTGPQHKGEEGQSDREATEKSKDK